MHLGYARVSTDAQDLTNQPTHRACRRWLHLKARDLHVSIAGLVSASQPLMDMAASLVAVRNGKKAALASLLQLVRMGAKEEGRN